MANKKPKALIVEQSASSIAGHYLEYAKRISSILQSDFDVTILASRKMASQSRNDLVEIVPTFTYGYWDYPFKSGFLKSVYKIAQRLKSKKDFKTSLELQVLTKSKKVHLLIVSISVLLIPVVLAWQILKKIMGAAIHLILRVKSILRKELFLITSRISQLNQARGFPSRLTKHKGKKFKKELQDYISKSGEKPSLIFCGTITAIEILELSKLFSHKKNSPKIVVVVRREPAEEHLSKQFWKLLGSSFDPKVIKLFADTVPLSMLWSDLLEYPVRVLPIPTWFAEELKTSISKSGSGLSYLGDAREEKNFNDLVALTPLLVARNEALFAQANYGSSAKLGVQSARNELVNRSDKLIIATKHPLDTFAYSEAILNSRIIYVNYDVTNYSYRSSGVFVEALMAKKPVVVSDGSWMHFELFVLSRIFWEERARSSAAPLDTRNTLHLTALDLLSFMSKPDGKITFEVRLNTGVVLNSTSWTDGEGRGYLPLPNLNDSEYVEYLAPKDTNVNLRDVTISKLTDEDPKYLGGVVAEFGRSPLALAEFFRAPSAYSNSCLTGIESFQRFHSMDNIKKLILEDFRS